MNYVIAVIVAVLLFLSALSTIRDLADGKRITVRFSHMLLAALAIIEIVRQLSR